MGSLLKKNFNGLKPSVYSSLTMAFAGMGDAFLYPFLPVYAAAIGMPLAWVGVLLSVNRVARIFLSVVVIKGFKTLGIRNITIIASVLAICSTAGYGLNAGIVVWLLCRIVWGLCFSVFRISTVSYALNSERKGFALGISNGIYEIGPLLALSVAPVIVTLFTIEHSLYILSVVSSVSLFFALRLPGLAYAPPKSESKIVGLPSAVNMLTFLTALAESILIISLGILTQKNYALSNLEAASLAAGMILFRRVCFIIISPIGGALNDRLGVRRIAVVSLLSISCGLILVTGNILLTGLLVTFIFNAVSNVVLPIAALSKNEDQIKTITANSAFKDAGTALGTLGGGFLLTSMYINGFLQVVAVLQVFLVLYWAKTVKS